MGYCVDINALYEENYIMKSRAFSILGLQVRMTTIIDVLMFKIKEGEERKSGKDRALLGVILTV